MILRYCVSVRRDSAVLEITGPSVSQHVQQVSLVRSIQDDPWFPLPLFPLSSSLTHYFVALTHSQLLQLSRWLCDEILMVLTWSLQLGTACCLSSSRVSLSILSVHSLHCVLCLLRRRNMRSIAVWISWTKNWNLGRAVSLSMFHNRYHACL